MRGAPKRHTLTPIAETTGPLADFAPYVSSINDAGTVAFQATLQGGGTGLFTGDGGPVVAAADGSGAVVRQLHSHPDINSENTLCIYGALASGSEGVLVVKGGAVVPIADTSGPFARIGPLGPTMNDSGAVAFRADTRAGRSGVFVARGGSIVTVADTTRFAGFQGLPVINGKGTVVFRADLETGGHGIYLSRGQGLEAVAVTGDHFRELGLFPCLDDEDRVVFSATLSDGDAGIFTVAGGETTTIAGTSAGFESFRGALLNDAGTVFFYATPRGGLLGIYAVTDSIIDPVLAVGDPLFDSSVVGFALNPVSVNNRDQLAIRVRLANGRHLIVRAAPPA